MVLVVTKAVHVTFCMTFNFVGAKLAFGGNVAQLFSESSVLSTCCKEQTKASVPALHALDSQIPKCDKIISTLVTKH